MSSRRRVHLRNTANNQQNAPSQNNNSTQNRTQPRTTTPSNQQNTAAASHVYNAMHDLLNSYIQLHTNGGGGAQNVPSGGTVPGQARMAGPGVTVGGNVAGMSPQGGPVATFSIPMFSGFLPHLQNMVSTVCSGYFNLRIYSGKYLRANFRKY